MADQVAVAAPAPIKAVKPKKAKSTKPKSTGPSYFDMICAAITKLAERGGSSRQAILKFICANYKIDPKTGNVHLKQALKHGIKAKTLKQVKGTGASGSFKIGEKKKVVKKVKKVKKPKVKKVKKVKKATKKTTKKTTKKVTKKVAAPAAAGAAPAAAKPKKAAAAKKPKVAKKTTTKVAAKAKLPGAKKAAPKKAAVKKVAKKAAPKAAA